MKYMAKNLGTFLMTARSSVEGIFLLNKSLTSLLESIISRKRLLLLL